MFTISENLTDKAQDMYTLQKKRMLNRVSCLAVAVVSPGVAEKKETEWMHTHKNNKSKVLMFDVSSSLRCCC